MAMVRETSSKPSTASEARAASPCDARDASAGVVVACAGSRASRGGTRSHAGVLTARVRARGARGREIINPRTPRRRPRPRGGGRASHDSCGSRESGLERVVSDASTFVLHLLVLTQMNHLLMERMLVRLLVLITLRRLLTILSGSIRVATSKQHISVSVRVVVRRKHITL